MARILFAWELGGGLGHLMRLAPLAKALRAKGHDVFLASRDLTKVEGLLAGSDVKYVAAPFLAGNLGNAFREACSFAHILHNVGFGSDALIAAHTAAWRNLYQLIKPDLTVFDHSPTALLAARGVPMKKVLIGSGFCIPPNVTPFPNLRPANKYDPQKLAADEDAVLQRVNRLLHTWQEWPLRRLSQFYAEVDAQFLTTFAELDHYAQRGDAQYWGPINAIESGGKDPTWPKAPGPRIYGYLKHFPSLDAILTTLNELRMPALIYCDGIPPEVRRKHASSTLVLETNRLNIRLAAERCDLAITNATLGTTSAMLMAGRPLFMVPMVLEQSILAKRIEQQGAGMQASIKGDANVATRLKTFIANRQSYQPAATALANSFAGFDPQARLIGIVQQLERLLPAQLDTRHTGSAAARVVLLVRRSRSYWIDGQIDAFGILTPDRAKLARAAIEWWDRTYKTSYLQFRARMRDLAQAFYPPARFDETISWLDQDAVNRQPEGTWLVPVDEDDWLDPAVTHHIRTLATQTSTNLITWDVIRKNVSGIAGQNPKPFVESCGYAVRLPCDWQWIEDHMSLGPADDGIPRRPATHVRHVLAIRNQTPASLGLFMHTQLSDVPTLIRSGAEAPGHEIPAQFQPTFRRYQQIVRNLIRAADSPADAPPSSTLAEEPIGLRGHTRWQ